VEHKDGTDWIKCCTIIEADEIRQRGHPTKTWWDGVREDMKRLPGECTGLEQMAKECQGATGKLRFT